MLWHPNSPVVPIIFPSKWLQSDSTNGEMVKWSPHRLAAQRGGPFADAAWNCCGAHFIRGSPWYHDWTNVARNGRFLRGKLWPSNEFSIWMSIGTRPFSQDRLDFGSLRVQNAAAHGGWKNLSQLLPLKNWCVAFGAKKADASQPGKQSESQLFWASSPSGDTARKQTFHGTVFDLPTWRHSGSWWNEREIHHDCGDSSN